MNNRLRNSDKITMDVIAQNLQVSKTTVSRAISGKGRVGRETRDRVLKYIASLGYKPNSMARALAGSKTYNIGVVIPDTDERGGAPFFKDCLIGVTAASAKRDYETVLAVISDGNYNNLERLVNGRRVDGLVLTRGDKNGKIVSYLREQAMPFVLIGRNSDDDVYQIDSDQKDGCCELTARMLRESPKGVALLSGPKDMDVERLRYEGYAQAFTLAGLKVDESLVFWDSEKKLDEALDKILESGVNCVACSDDIICLKVMEALKQRGVSVPGRLQVVSFFDSENLESNDVPVTSLHVDTKVLSQKAGDLLIDVLDGKNPDLCNYAKCSVLYRSSFRNNAG
ncbi:MAG: LacI family transcriptional regulator [Treponema sp.]|nr:LacI family transcriptional regulator [Treponema sp.]